MSILNDGSLNAFLRACGARQPLHVLLRQRQTGNAEKLQLRYPFAVIGRHVRSDVPVPDWQISTRHAYLQVFNGAVFCADLGSKTGLEWRSGREGANWFVPNDALLLGNYELELCGPSAKLTVNEPVPISPLRKPEDPDERPVAWLEFLTGKCPDRYWRVSRPMVMLGRGSWCKLQFSHSSVSTVHCVLLWQGGSLWIVDLNSRTGIQVNGLPQRWARLNDGDTFSLGVFTIRCHYTAPDERGQNLFAPPLPETAAPTETDITARSLPATDVDESDTQPLPSMDGTSLELAKRGDVERAGSDLTAVQPSVRDGQAEQVNVTPAGAELPVTLTRGDLGWLIDQMTVFQQQVFDQSQQFLLMVLQAFGRMHKEQMTVIQRELEALKEINRELAWLKTRLAQARHASEGAKQPAAGRVSAAVRVAAGPNGTSLPGKAKPDDSQPASPAGSGIRAEQPQPTSRRGAQRNESDQPKGKKRTSKPGVAAERSSQAARCDEAAATSVGDEAEDIHAWLCQRLAQLQEEQASRWQRVMQLLASPFNAGSDRLP